MPGRAILTLTAMAPSPSCCYTRDTYAPCTSLPHVSVTVRARVPKVIESPGLNGVVISYLVYAVANIGRYKATRTYHGLFSLRRILIVLP